MNFLAHIYLSGNQEKVIVGNFIGDFVKGKVFEEFEDGIQKGILLHREIDRFTDEHKVVFKSKKRLRPKYHHYAPVIVDVFYDHFLANLWPQYHEEDLKEYVDKFYELMLNFTTVIPQAANRMLKYMVRDNWLYNYQYTEGVNQTLRGMSRRTSFDSKMEQATVDLIQDYQVYQEEFVTFFPDLKDHASTYLNSLI